MHKKVRTRRQRSRVLALDDPIRVEDRMTAVCVLSFATRRCRSMPFCGLMVHYVLVAFAGHQAPNASNCTSPTGGALHWNKWQWSKGADTVAELHLATCCAGSFCIPSCKTAPSLVFERFMWTAGPQDEGGPCCPSCCGTDTTPPPPQHKPMPPSSVKT